MMNSVMEKKHEPLSSKALARAVGHIHALILEEEQIFNDAGSLKEVLRRFEVVYDDIDEHELEALRHELKQLKALVYKDELTGVLNRRGVYDKFDGFFREALFAKEHADLRKGVVINDFSVLFFDIDNFKKINDTHGHAEGDRVLAELAGVLLKGIRDIDAVGRLGGEEFVVGLLGAPEEEACTKAEAFRANAEETLRVAGVPITVSVGVASLRHSKSQTLDELIAAADEAMYEAKTNRGKNAVVCYSELSK